MSERERLKNLILFICEKCDNPAELGAVKINKTLWFSDLIAYRFSGKSISHVDYVKMQYGPVPYCGDIAIRELQSEGKLVVREDTVFGYSKKTFINLQKPDLSYFSADELKLVSMLTHEICKNYTATAISELSHDVVWEAAAMGEKIPLAATLVSEPAPITDEDRDWALRVIGELEAS